MEFADRHDPGILNAANMPTVLVVDDTPEILLLISELLHSQYRVTVAESGEAALALLQTMPVPDLMLLDVIMPQVDGYEVCRRLKRDPRLASMPVVFLTARSEAQDETFGLQLGAADYITKPIVPAVLMARVETQIRAKAGTDLLLQHNAWMQAQIARNAEEIRAKTRVLTTASHNLRQPVHVLGIMADEMCRDLQGSPLGERMDNMAIVIQGLSDSLVVLMNAARLDAGLVEVVPEVFPACDLIEKIRAEFVASARSKHLRLEAGGTQVAIRCDRAIAASILQNLVSNAIRYTDAGSVTLTAWEVGGKVRFSVTDTGRGISAGRLPDIFEEHKRIDLFDRARGGLGLGLSIVKRFAAMLGSEIVIKSELGKGTTVTFDLPVAADEPSRVLPAPPPAGGDVLQGLRIALFEDDPLVLQATSRMLTEWGCEVTAHSDIDDWMNGSPEVQVPDVVIADHHLHESFNGLDLIARNRRHYPVPLAAMLLTGDIGEELVARAAGEGVVVQHKPLRPSRLRAALIELASSRSTVS